MLEIPEAVAISQQLTQSVRGKTIQSAVANYSLHKFAWYFGDPENYTGLLSGIQLESAFSFGGLVELHAAKNLHILFQDGVNLRFLPSGSSLPKKHQLLLRFDDGSYLAASIQMYGGIMAFREGENENPYYLVAKEKPSPLEAEFDEMYFEGLFSCAGFQKLSAKAFLATEQRVPGLGNGVLQDILWNARIHPKRRMNDLSDPELALLFHSVKDTLSSMARQHGRDTEKDLFGLPGGYHCILSRNTLNSPCPSCGSPLKKEAYLGGSIYFCPSCQPYKAPSPRGLKKKQ